MGISLVWLGTCLWDGALIWEWEYSWLRGVGVPTENKGVMGWSTQMKSRVFLGYSLSKVKSVRQRPGTHLVFLPRTEVQTGNSLESPLEQGAKCKKVSGNRVPSMTRSTVVGVVPALACPAWGSGRTGRRSADLAHYGTCSPSNPLAVQGPVFSQLIGSSLIGLRQEPGGSQPIG